MQIADGHGQNGTHFYGEFFFEDTACIRPTISSDIDAPKNTPLMVVLARMEALVLSQLFRRTVTFWEIIRYCFRLLSEE